MPAHFAILRYPGPENRRPSELEAQLGYLPRDDDPDDQGFKHVHLTARGHAAAQAIRDGVADQLRELLIQLNAASLVREFHGRPGATAPQRQAID